MAVIIQGIDIPKKHYMNGYYISDDGKVFDVSRKNVVGKAMQIPSEQSEPHWIPTSKERPPQYKEIWITSDLGDVELVYGKNDIWWLDECYYTEPEIIAWMPADVPSPYQLEEE